MTHRMLLIKADGSPVEVVEVRSIDDMARVIDAEHIERVRVAEDVSLAVDEGFLFGDKPLNVTASVMYGTPRHGSPIKGDVLLGIEAYAGAGISWVDCDNLHDRALGVMVDRLAESVIGGL